VIVKAIIKGDEDTLLECIVLYPIKVIEYEIRTREDSDLPDIFATIEVENVETLHEWFRRGGTNPPFPKGTLLYWNEVQGHRAQSPGTNGL
jgi:hypothetical protein